MATVASASQKTARDTTLEQEAERSLQISHRGYVLVDGRNAFEDTARTILDDERIRATFLGTAPG